MLLSRWVSSNWPTFSSRAQPSTASRWAWVGCGRSAQAVADPQVGALVQRSPFRRSAHGNRWHKPATLPPSSMRMPSDVMPPCGWSTKRKLRLAQAPCRRRSRIGFDDRADRSGVAVEGIGEARARAARARRRGHGAAPARRERARPGARSSMPWQWSAWSWVTITRVDAADVGGEQLLAQVGAAIDQQRLAAAFDQDRRAQCGGCAARRGRTRPSRSRSAARRTRSRSRGSAPSRGGFAEQIGRSWRSSLRPVSSSVSPRKLGDERGGVGDEGRLAGLAAVRHRREEGRVGLDQQPVVRDRLGGFLQVAWRS